MPDVTRVSVNRLRALIAAVFEAAGAGREDAETARAAGRALGSSCGIALVLVGLLGPVSAHAQPPANMARIGYLGDDPVGGAHLRGAFLQGLRDLGHVEGRNVVIEYRFVQGKHERFPALADELVALKVDVIVVGPTRSALAAKQATRTLPIVFAAVGDAVASGLVTSLARPGGNLTGLSNLAPALAAKCLEQLTQAVPGVGRVAVLWQPGALDERTEKEMLTGRGGCGAGAGGEASIR